jgi:hypothetical protein
MHISAITPLLLKKLTHNASLLMEMSGKVMCSIGFTRCINETILSSGIHDVDHITKEVLNNPDEGN